MVKKFVIILLCGMLMFGIFSVAKTAVVPNQHFDVVMYNDILCNKDMSVPLTDRNNREAKDIGRSASLAGRISIPSIAFDKTAVNGADVNGIDTDSVVLLDCGDVFLLTWTPQTDCASLRRCKAGTVAYFDDGEQKTQLVCISSFEKNKMKSVIPGYVEEMQSENERQIKMLYFRPVWE